MFLDVFSTSFLLFSASQRKDNLPVHVGYCQDGGMVLGTTRVKRVGVLPCVDPHAERPLPALWNLRGHVLSCRFVLSPLSGLRLGGWDGG